jgi:hypothetical protein
MATDLETFKSCVRARANLDFEAMDVLWIQPLKDLIAWYQRQSEKTKNYVNLITAGGGVIGGLARDAIQKFLKAVLPAGFTDAVLQALGAALVGIALGLAVAALIECSIFDVPQV